MGGGEGGGETVGKAGAVFFKTFFILGSVLAFRVWLGLAQKDWCGCMSRDVSSIVVGDWDGWSHCVLYPPCALYMCLHLFTSFSVRQVSVILESELDVCWKSVSL